MILTDIDHDEEEQDYDIDSCQNENDINSNHHECQYCCNGCNNCLIIGW
jgi:hypothetical protein